VANRLLANKWAKSIVTVGIVFAIGLGAAWLLDHEPTGPERCEQVKILGVRKGNRGVEEFIVESVNTSQRRLVGRFNRPFPADYTGPAALWIKVGRWTGWEQYKMSHSCVDSVSY
jgi:hypothetical protein